MILNPTRKWSTKVAFLPLIVFIGCTGYGVKSQYLLAEKLWAEHEYRAAVAEFEKVSKRDPKGELGIQSLYRSAITQALFLFEYAEAVEKLRSYSKLVKNPKLKWSAEKQIGEILFLGTKDHNEALKHYQQMVEENPDRPEVPQFLYRVGKSYYHLWKFNDSIETFKRIVKEYPNSTWAEKAAFEIGRTYFTSVEHLSIFPEERQANYKKALTQYRNFLDNYPGSKLAERAKFGIGSCLEELDQLEDAYKVYQDISETFPDRQVIAIKLARIKQRISKRDR